MLVSCRLILWHELLMSYSYDTHVYRLKLEYQERERSERQTSRINLSLTMTNIPDYSGNGLSSFVRLLLGTVRELKLAAPVPARCLCGPLRSPDRDPCERQSRDTGSNKDGGARRSRTDDLLNANQALSQLSYGPVTGIRQVACPALRYRRLRWWAEEELNFRPHAYQACALTT